MINKNFDRALSVGLYGLVGVYLLWYLFLLLFETDVDTSKNYFLFSATYSLIALFGVLIGLYASRIWSNMKSITGKALIFISLGLLFQYLGQFVYSFWYQAFNTEPVYPSTAELFFVISLIMYFIGSLYLIKINSTELKNYKSNTRVKLLTVFFMLVLFTIAIGNFYINHKNDETIDYLVWGLEILYPLIQSTFIGLAILSLYFSKNLFGGLVKKPISYIVIGLFLQYVADTVFIYVPMKISDIFYLGSFIFIVLGLFEFSRLPLRIQLVSDEELDYNNE